MLYSNCTFILYFSYQLILISLCYFSLIVFLYSVSNFWSLLCSVLMLNMGLLCVDKDFLLLVKFSHTRYRALGPELIPVYRQSARRWLFKSSPAVGCHCLLPGLRSPSQLKNITVLQPVPSYTAWWQRHIGVNNLPKVVTRLCLRWDCRYMYLQHSHRQATVPPTYLL